MTDDNEFISRSIAETAQMFLQPMGHQGLIRFLNQQITEAQWKIARHRAEIAAYEQAISLLEAGREPRELANLSPDSSKVSE